MKNELLPSGYNPLEEMLRPRRRTAVVGGKGVGKSLFMLQLGICASSGVDYLGYPATKTRVLYINAETFRKPFEARIADVESALGICCGPESGFTAVQEKNHYTPMDELVTKIIETGEIFGCVMIDPVWHFMPGDENNSADADVVARELARLCDALGCAVVFSNDPHGGLVTRCADTVVDLTRNPPLEETGKVTGEDAAASYSIGLRGDGVMGDIPGRISFAYPLFSRK